MDRRPKNRGRKDGKAGKDGGAPKGPPQRGRRVPPPEATGLEDRYLRERIDSGGALAVAMRDGRRVAGRIRGFDEDTITVEVEGGPELMIRKRDILYLEESG